MHARPASPANVPPLKVLISCSHQSNFRFAAMSLRVALSRTITRTFATARPPPPYVDKNTRVLCQGFTGKNGTFHSQQAIEYAPSCIAIFYQRYLTALYQLRHQDGRRCVAKQGWKHALGPTRFCKRCRSQEAHGLQCICCLRTRPHAAYVRTSVMHL